MTNDDRVIIGTNNATFTHYHTNKNCPNLPDSTREVDVEHALARGLPECCICKGEHSSRGDQQYVGLRQALQSDDYEVDYATND